MLHAGRGRGAFHKNRKPQGGTPTPAPAPVGNQLKPANIAAAYTMYTTTAVPGDVIDMDGAWFTSGAPYKWIFTKSFAAPGITINCKSDQIMQFFGDTITNARTRVVGANLGADIILGNATSSTNHNVQLNFCSLFSFFGCFSSPTTSCFFGFYTRGCSDITIRNNLVSFNRHDMLRHDESLTRADIRGNSLADNCPRMRAWYKADNTTPLYQTNTPAGYLQFDPDHTDGTQAFTGTWADTLYQSNYIKTNFGQGVFNSDANHVRSIFDANNILTSFPQAFWVGMSGGATDITVTNNTISKHPDYDPNSGNQKINLDAGANPVRLGLNVFNAGQMDITGTTAGALSGAISGTVAATSAPTWSTDGANVGTIPSKIGGQAFVPYASTRLLINPPDLVMDGTAAPWAAGSYIKAIMGNIKGPANSMFGLWDTCWTRWFKDAVQVAVGQGRAAMVSPVTTSGTWTSQQSPDSTDGVNGNWSPISTGATISGGGGSGATWDPAHTAATITLSASNTKAAADQGFNLATVTAFGTTAKLADGLYVLLMTPNPWTTSAQGIGFARAGLATNTSIGGSTNTFGLTKDGQITISGAFTGSTPAKSAGTTFEMYLGISGGGTVAKTWIYDQTAAAWLSSGGGGNPSGGGSGGWTISSFLGAGGITFGWNGDGGLGEACTIQTTGFTPQDTAFSVWG